MGTIRAWLHANLIDISETPAKLYKQYCSWLKAHGAAPVTFSLFKSMLTNIKLVEDEESLEEEYIHTPTPIPKAEPIIEEINPVIPEPIIEVQEEVIQPQEEIIEESSMDEEKIFAQIESYTASVCDSSSRDYAFIVSGDPGLGKTVSVTSVLNKVIGAESKPRQFFDVDENSEYIIESEGESTDSLEWIEGPTKITALQLYIFLYRENGKVILFDDADVLIEDSNNFDILKKVLDSKASRSVGYGAKPIILKKASVDGKDVIVPNSFQFEGRIIIVTNKPFHKIDTAIKSRSLVVEVDLSAEQCLKRVKRLLPFLCQDNPKATMEVKEEILEYLLSISNLFKKIDLRTTEQSINEYFRSPDNWKELVKTSIKLKTKT